MSIKTLFKQKVSSYYNKTLLTLEKLESNFSRADIALFHQFSPPPGGGGHQFLQALWNEFERRGLRIENNTISHTTRACLYNSYNFDFDRLRYFKRKRCRMVHRVDGPISIYRGRDEDVDKRIWEINQKLADATVFQSQYALKKHLEMGLSFKSPVIIMNAADPRIFNSQGRSSLNYNQKIRLISTSWSDNINKGAPVYKWLDEHLDWEKFEYSFVGRTPVEFKNIHIIPPLPLTQLANKLRQSNIYIFAGKHESCSNSLIEALSCGLPVLYIDSGSNSEIVKQAGIPFHAPEEIPDLLKTLIDDYDNRQARISLPNIRQVADDYLTVLGIEAY